MERTDIRDVATLPTLAQLAVVDVAFISLRLVLPHVRRLVTPDAQLIALVKPQFEAGRKEVPRGGVVRDETVQRSTLVRVLEAAIVDGWLPCAGLRSPVRGTSGNQEFLVLLARSEESAAEDRIEAVVNMALEEPPA
jgi:23S rRNA (cytidine1920-2'-O)/16S rRNA (cytidine1409-2'-O)-methyltransferase